MIAVIIEEAAEVMESHIVVSLTHHCEHLILIGMCCYCMYLFTELFSLISLFGTDYYSLYLLITFANNSANERKYIHIVSIKILCSFQALLFCNI
jgi:hypothetical protein